MAHATKDAVLVVDDWLPIDVRAQREANRLLRAQGNRAGRGRLRRDASFAPTYAPRGLILNTGEDVPEGESLLARLVIVHVGASDVDWNRLTAAQRDAGNGSYAAAVAAFVQWIASRLDDTGAAMGLRERRSKFEERLRGRDFHPRRTRNVADLLAGFDYFLEFARDVGAIDETERSRRAVWAFSALAEIDDDTDDPALSILELLGQAIAAGCCHLADASGRAPDDASVWGWRDAEPRGPRIGYLRDDVVWLLPDAAYAVAADLARDAGVRLVSARMTWRRLGEAGLISYESGRQRWRVRRRAGGATRAVIELSANLLRPSAVTDEPDDAPDDLEAELRRPIDPDPQGDSTVTGPTIPVGPDDAPSADPVF